MNLANAIVHDEMLDWERRGLAFNHVPAPGEAELEARMAEYEERGEIWRGVERVRPAAPLAKSAGSRIIATAR